MLLSVVVPCYNEEAVLELSLNTLCQALADADIEDYEIICVDDGSKDRTLEVLEFFSRKNPKIKAAALAANRGPQAALYAGMCYTSGEAVVLIDADLQDPPSLIPAMLQKWQEGYQVVYGKRSSRSGETAFKLFTAYLYYRIINIFTYTPIPKDVGDFRLMDRSVVDVMVHMPEHYRFTKGIVSWLGFKQCEIAFERSPRAAGETKLSVKHLIGMAKDSFFAFSYMPIQFIQWTGVFSLFIAFGLLVYALVSKFLNVAASGWSSLIIVIIFFSGMILISLGIIGEYLARIHIEVLQRPIFISKRTLNLKGKQLPSHLEKFHSSKNSRLQ